MSRDQEDIAALYKRLSFAGIRIVTLAEGDVSELHVGLKGTMNALFLRDPAAKTHRGQRGRVEAAKLAGGNAFGYRVVRTIGPDGQLTTGERRIEAAEAEVVRRIFQDYAVGDSPRAIALRLNAEAVAGPRAGQWSASTINGNRTRGTGILNNELYIGRLVWNRLAYVKDPETGRRRSRQRSTETLVTTVVPDLRILDQDLWDRVKARQAVLGAKGAAPADGSGAFWSKQRPRYLFSGLMCCGVCGGGFCKISQEHFGCSTARNKGPTACTNRLTIRRDRLEAEVLDDLRHRLMDPDLFQVFVTAFTAGWNRLQAAGSAEQEAKRAELQRVKHAIERLVDAITEGTPASAVRDRLADLETRRLALEATLASAAAPAPRLNPNLAEIYRVKVADLIEALRRHDAAAAREQVRGLVDEIRLVPDDGALRVEIRRELAAILRLAEGTRNGLATAGVVRQVKMVAGTGFEPVTFRL